MRQIAEFVGQYRFLSNFYTCTITYDGIIYNSLEHYYVAMKTTDLTVRRFISGIATAGQVKRYGRQNVVVRPDWDDVKLQVMEYGLRQKFTDPELAKLLLSTDDAKLVEGNFWHDYFWGVCSCDKCNYTGYNYLGKLLMKVRSDLKKNINNGQD